LEKEAKRAKLSVNMKVKEILVKSALTKSGLPVVCRDIDIFSHLKNVSVGLTITSLDDEVSRFLEGNAPVASSRINVLKELHSVQIPIYAFVGPLLPYFTAQVDKIEELFRELKNAGVVKAYVEHINLSPKIRKRLFDYLKKTPALIPYFEKAQTSDYRKNLEKTIYPIALKNNIKIIGGKVLRHGD
jgi:DNA repair photolyase